MSRICVTGSGGFVGRHLVPALVNAGHEVVLGVRTASPPASIPTVSVSASVSAFGPSSTSSLVNHTTLKWQAADSVLVPMLQQAQLDVVIHAAGLAHGQVAGTTPADLLSANAQATANFFEAVQRAQVPRFIWLSSIKVLGETSAVPLTEEAPLRPQSAYAKSKATGEMGLLALAESAANTTPTALTIVRPPLVYGPGVSGNMLKLLRLANSGLPLPLGCADGQRTMVSIANLVNLLEHTLTGPPGIYHAADDESASVAELLRQLRALMSRSALLLPVPNGWLRGVAALVGRQSFSHRLLDPLLVSTTQTQQQLQWQAPQRLQAGLEETLQWYLTQR